MITIVTQMDDTLRKYIHKNLKPINRHSVHSFHDNRLIEDTLVKGSDLVIWLRDVVSIVMQGIGFKAKDVFPIGIGESLPILSQRVSPYYHDPSLISVRDGKLCIVLPRDEDLKKYVVQNHVIRGLLLALQKDPNSTTTDVVSMTRDILLGLKLPELERHPILIISDEDVDDIAQSIEENQRVGGSIPGLKVSRESVIKILVQHDWATEDFLSHKIAVEHRISTFRAFLDELPHILVALTLIIVTLGKGGNINFITRTTSYVYLASLGYDIIVRSYSVFTISSHRWMASVLVATGIFSVNKGNVTVGALMILVGLITMSLFEKQINDLFDTLSDTLTSFFPWRRK